MQIYAAGHGLSGAAFSHDLSDVILAMKSIHCRTQSWDGDQTIVTQDAFEEIATLRRKMSYQVADAVLRSLLRLLTRTSLPDGR